MAIEHRVLTVGQVAKICKVAPRTVSKWFDSGRLRGYRIPGSQDMRIPREMLVRFLEEYSMTDILNDIDPVCTNCEQRESRHYHEDQVYCTANTNGDLFTTEPTEEDRLRAEIASLRKDAERLEYIASQAYVWSGEEDFQFCCPLPKTTKQVETLNRQTPIEALRATIDAAILRTPLAQQLTPERLDTLTERLQSEDIVEDGE